MQLYTIEDYFAISGGSVVQWVALTHLPSRPVIRCVNQWPLSNLTNWQIGAKSFWEMTIANNNLHTFGYIVCNFM